MEDCPNKPKLKNNKNGRKGKGGQCLTNVNAWDDSSSEEEAHHRRFHHKLSSSSSHICLMARNIVERENDEVIVTPLLPMKILLTWSNNFKKLALSTKQKSKLGTKDS